jgi:hypothetical protein
VLERTHDERIATMMPGGGAPVYVADIVAG